MTRTELKQRTKQILMDSDLENNALLTARKSYTGKHYIGEIVHHGYHECVVTEVWNVDGKNGISIKPSGRYGFEIDIYDEQL